MTTDLHTGHRVFPLGVTLWCDTCQCSLGHATLLSSPIRSDGSP